MFAGGLTFPARICSAKGFVIGYMGDRTIAGTFWLLVNFTAASTPALPMSSENIITSVYTLPARRSCKTGHAPERLAVPTVACFPALRIADSAESVPTLHHAPRKFRSGWPVIISWPALRDCSAL